METWRINSEGKANLLFQFNRSTDYQHGYHQHIDYSAANSILIVMEPVFNLLEVLKAPP